MDCADAKLRMEPCASGALVPEELALFEEHIASCEGCRLELELVRAMGSNKAGEATGEPKGDDWTLDRIFGAEASKGSAASPAESEALPIAPITDIADQAATDVAAVDQTTAAAVDQHAAAAVDQHAAEPPSETPPVAADPHDTSMMFETTPNPMPPDAPADNAASLFDEPAAAVPAIPEPIADAVMSAEALNPARSADAPPPSEMTNAWDFEPADAKPDATLPEGSLFFAEETLARKGDARKSRNTLKRMVLWGVGAVVGIALLAVSLWLVLSAREQDADRRAAAARSAVPATGAAMPDSGAASETGDASEAPPPVTPDVVTQPADEVVAKPPATSSRSSDSPVLGARALTGSGVPSISTPTRSGSQPVAPRSTSGTPAATAGKGDPKKAAPTTANGTTKGGATASENPTSKGSSGGPGRAPDSHVTATEDLDPEQLELRAPPPPVPATPEQNVPFAGASKSGTASPPVRGPVVVAPPPVTSSEPNSTASPADQVQRPIDRLHLATVTAEQGSDLVALRKLRDTWKGLVRTSVGPDRARAKRELADCLWAVQSLTGRNSDKKDALAAYREYLLNAPAGGADPRTVARMRQLEDALAESK